MLLNAREPSRAPVHVPGRESLVHDGAFPHVCERSKGMRQRLRASILDAARWPEGSLVFVSCVPDGGSDVLWWHHSSWAAGQLAQAVYMSIGGATVVGLLANLHRQST